DRDHEANPGHGQPAGIAVPGRGADRHTAIRLRSPAASHPLGGPVLRRLPEHRLADRPAAEPELSRTASAQDGGDRLRRRDRHGPAADRVKAGTLDYESETYPDYGVLAPGGGVA